MAKEKRMINPTWCDCPHEEGKSVCLQVELPGVQKDDVDVQIRTDSVSVKAERGDIEYIGNWGFCCPIAEGKAKAKFDNGLLTISAPLKSGPPFKKVPVE